MRHERPQHADLDGAEAAASGKHERRLRLVPASAEGDGCEASAILPNPN